MNKGELTEITIITDITLNPNLVEPLNVSGIFVSVKSISLLNLFKIRPIGVDSKNCILQCKILLSIVLCRFFDALTYIKANIKSAKNTSRPYNKY